MQNLKKIKRKIRLFLLLILIIIIYMADPTWGMLPKSQIDPQLIEERIAEMIAEHEQDPEAHMGAGESIDIHRKNDVIDHPAFSVVPDKVTRGAIEINTNLAFFDLYDYNGDWSRYGFSEAVLEMGSGSGHYWLYAFASAMYTNNQIKFSKKPIFSITFLTAYSINGTLKMLAGNIDNNQGFGFKISGTTLKGVYYNSSGTLVETTLLTISTNTSYKLEARFIHTGDLEFWVNDELITTVSSITDKTPENTIIYMPYIDYSKSAGTSVYLVFKDAYLQSEF